MLPHEIAVLAAEADARRLHRPPRRALAARTSTACSIRRAPSPFERGRSLWWPHRVDLAALHACAHALHGIHDFTAFTPTETYHRRFTREILSRVAGSRRGDVLEFRIEADASCAT